MVQERFHMLDMLLIEDVIANVKLWITHWVHWLKVEADSSGSSCRAYESRNSRICVQANDRSPVDLRSSSIQLRPARAQPLDVGQHL